MTFQQTHFFLRPEAPADVAELEALSLAAFALNPHSRQTEAQVVAQLRAAGDLFLSLVAQSGQPQAPGALVGHAVFTRITIDGGACDVGIESTIVDCTRGAPVLLRPGGISRAQVEAACGQPLRDGAALDAPDPKASGTLLAHYAPAAPVRLMDAKALQTALDLLGADAAHIATWSRAILKTPSSGVIRRRMPDDAAVTAQQLFAVLREFDAQGVRLIWIETPPDTPEWEAVRDRLQRAAAA